MVQFELGQLKVLVKANMAPEKAVARFLLDGIRGAAMGKPPLLGWRMFWPLRRNVLRLSLTPSLNLQAPTPPKKYAKRQ